MIDESSQLYLVNSNLLPDNSSSVNKDEQLEIYGYQMNINGLVVSLST